MRYIALVVVLAVVPAKPEAVSETLPQFPAADVCARNSWTLWHCHMAFREAIECHGDDGNMGVLASGCAADSWAWWWAATLQAPGQSAEARMDAQRQLFEAIGEERFRRGLMPPVPGKRSEQ